MALTVGQLVSGAGRVGAAWRSEEEAQRVAQQNQLKIEEQNRLNRFRQNELQAQIPNAMPLDIQPAYNQNFGMETIAPPAAPIVNAPQDIIATPETMRQPQVRPATPGGGMVPIVPARPTMDPKEIERMKAMVPMGPVDRAVVGGLRAVQGAIYPESLPPGTYRANANQPVWTPAATIDVKPTMDLAEIERMRASIGLTKPAKKQTTAEKKLEDLKVKSYNLPTQPTDGQTVNPELQPATKLRDTFAASTIKTLTPDVQNYFASLEQQNGIPQGVLAAILDQESGGRAGLSSSAGAAGYFGFMPDAAKQYNVKVNDLGSSAAGAAKLVGDLYRKYNGDMTKVLAAYNWGPGNVDRKGLSKAPLETRNYVPSVLAKMGQAVNPVGTAEAATAAQPTIVPATAAKVGDLPAPKEQKKIGDFYLANPNAIPEDTARAMRQRDELVRLAKSYQSAGMGLEFTGVRAKIMELDESMFYLQGMQGLNDLAFANDPRRLAAVWSRAKGQPIGIQPRSDGMYNVFINGNKIETPYSADDVSKAARSTFDSAYVKQVTELQIGQYTEGYKSQLKVAEENAKQLAQMIREVAVERVKGSNDQALQYMKDNFNWDIKPTGAGDGTVIIRAPGSAPVMYNPTGKTVEIDGVKITSNAATPIAGLPSYSGLPPIK